MTMLKNWILTDNLKLKILAYIAYAVTTGHREGHPYIQKAEKLRNYCGSTNLRWEFFNFDPQNCDNLSKFAKVYDKRTGGKIEAKKDYIRIYESGNVEIITNALQLGAYIHPINLSFFEDELPEGSQFPSEFSAYTLMNRLRNSQWETIELTDSIIKTNKRLKEFCNIKEIPFEVGQKVKAPPECIGGYVFEGLRDITLLRRILRFLYLQTPSLIIAPDNHSYTSLYDRFFHADKETGNYSEEKSQFQWIHCLRKAYVNHVIISGIEFGIEFATSHQVKWHDSATARARYIDMRFLDDKALKKLRLEEEKLRAQGELEIEEEGEEKEESTKTVEGELAKIEEKEKSKKKGRKGKKSEEAEEAED